MFDFAWSEIALIGVVALIAIGPKDMPVAIKAVTDMIKKARRMAAEFQTHVDDMVKDANLNEVRDHLNDLRTMDIKGKILSAIDSDQTMRKALNEDPFKTTPAASSYTAPAVTETAAAEPAAATVLAGATPLAGDALPLAGDALPIAAAPAIPVAPAAPAFIPPSEVPVPVPPAPAFIPPGTAGPRV